MNKFTKEKVYQFADALDKMGYGHIGKELRLMWSCYTSRGLEGDYPVVKSLFECVKYALGEWWTKGDGCREGYRGWDDIRLNQIHTDIWHYCVMGDIEYDFKKAQRLLLLFKNAGYVEKNIGGGSWKTVKEIPDELTYKELSDKVKSIKEFKEICKTNDKNRWV